MPDEPIPEHGGQLRAIAARFAVPQTSLLDFSASINPVPPSEAVLAGLCRTIRAGNAIACYPDSNYLALKNAIAQYIGVDADSVSIGNGVMPLLVAALRVTGSRRCMVLTPAFSEYERSLVSCGVACLPFILRSEDGFAIAPNRIVEQLKRTGADTLLFANPHSPSGRLFTASELFDLHHVLSEMRVNAIVDEAFIDYVPEESLCTKAMRSTRLIVLRSLTKFFAMPGLRVGYAVSHSKNRTGIENAMPLWPVDAIAAEAACMALQDAAFIKATKENNKLESIWLADQLRQIGMCVFPSAANYLLVRIRDGLDGLELWRRLIVEHGIVLRSCANFAGLDSRYFRIGIRTRSESHRLIAALRHYIRFE